MTSLPPTLVVGCGLIGTSVALALREHGIDVHLRDRDPEHVAAAVERGAGSAEPVHDPALVVVAVPPRATAAAVREALETYPAAVVTDVASVKGSVAREVAGGAGLDRYVGSHPMAGSERPAAGATDAAVRLVEEVAVMLGAVPTVMDADTHDRAVALVSHVPQVLSTLTAARLVDAPPAHLALAGQGLRDVTRVAGSDPALWRDIITTNAEEIGAVLTAVRDDLDTLIDALRDRDVVGGVLEAGRVGTRAIPGKHGGEPVELVVVNVQVPDTPGALSRLFAHVGESGVNIEDLRIDHELGRPVGLVEIAVAADRADELVARLTERAWSAYR
ncbi:prephenate dehydrogenase [Aeromicrobium sp. REDSEA-S32_B7]|uniref:prephenate dehydrogenase n=1 Tax=Aeromicrobium sp. REDSEA-S32_B7 TaxID=1811526 RepID=UPI000A7AF2CF|nr:prephenate dehydrogenase [Aeromicrobium sp. REDSEA-S32_B7]